jgi:hypothetical protein
MPMPPVTEHREGEALPNGSMWPNPSGSERLPQPQADP